MPRIFVFRRYLRPFKGIIEGDFLEIYVLFLIMVCYNLIRRLLIRHANKKDIKKKLFFLEWFRNPMLFS